ncbi:MAG: hypothetical protein Q8912_00360 [Bacillota bacterium]|nr:hypothetical protein [Bacillota bacterium]
MLKTQRERGRRRRRLATFLLLFFVILLLSGGSFAWRIERLRKAESIYDVQKVKEELQWFKEHGGLINKLEFIKDTTMWLELNIGSTDLEPKLAIHHDEKHQFWLFLLNLQTGKMNEAQNVLGVLGKTPVGQLGQGLMCLTKGDAKESRHLLTRTDVGWATLSQHEQTLRHLTLAQAAIILEDHSTTQSELQEAKQLEPQNPACLSLELDLAIKEEEWTKALEISNIIDLQTWKPKNTLYEAKKAILAIHEENQQKLMDSLTAFKELPRGEATIYYINGIQALHKGQLSEGKTQLEFALKSGLDDVLEADAQKALEQVVERLKAEKALQSVATNL